MKTNIRQESLLRNLLWRKDTSQKLLSKILNVSPSVVSTWGGDRSISKKNIEKLSQLNLISEDKNLFIENWFKELESFLELQSKKLDKYNNLNSEDIISRMTEILTKFEDEKEKYLEPVPEQKVCGECGKPRLII